MEKDLSNQSELLVQNVLCHKLNESDRSLLQTWLTSRLTIERCGWKRKLQVESFLIAHNVNISK